MKTSVISENTLLSNSNRTPGFIRYCLYPLLFVGTIILFTIGFVHQWDLALIKSLYTFTLVIGLAIIEAKYPLKCKWRMTATLFFKRDLFYFLIGGATLALVNYLASLAILSQNRVSPGMFEHLPFIPALLLAIYLVDFIWYWIHRLSHESKTKFGERLWRIHVAHHLPRQVYVLMHAVSHPLNIVVVRLVFIVPLFLLGFSKEVVFMVYVFVGLQGLVSHFNADIKAGWFNYFLMGTELHRYHHSANASEAKNYGSTVTAWDQLFGSYYYDPKHPPQHLGVNDPQAYPDASEILKVLKLPFGCVSDKKNL